MSQNVTKSQNVRISIVLDNPLVTTTKKRQLPTFVPGQTIAGEVTLELFKQKKIDEVKIVFGGMLTTGIKRAQQMGTLGTTAIWIWEIQKIGLFCRKQTLFQGPYTMQTTSMSWRFSFDIPLMTFMPSYETNPSHIWLAPGLHPIPPSFSAPYDRTAHFSLASVVYAIGVHVNAGQKFHHRQNILPILVMPVSSTLIPPPTLERVCFTQKHHKSRKLRPMRHSMKEKLAHIFTSQPPLKTPSLTFHAILHVPDVASIWQDLPLRVSIHLQQTGPTDPPNPNLILQKVTLRLYQFTALVVHTKTGRWPGQRKDKLGPPYVVVVDKPLPVDETPFEIQKGNASLKLADIVPEFYRLVPSFTTYTARLFYSLVIKFEIQNPETRRRFVFKSATALTIMPMDLSDLNPSRRALPLPEKAMDSTNAAKLFSEPLIELPYYESVAGPVVETPKFVEEPIPEGGSKGKDRSFDLTDSDDRDDSMESLFRVFYPPPYYRRPEKDIKAMESQIEEAGRSGDDIVVASSNQGKGKQIEAEHQNESARLYDLAAASTQEEETGGIVTNFDNFY